MSKSSPKMKRSKRSKRSKHSDRSAIWNEAIDAGLVVRWSLSFRRFLTVEDRNAFLAQVPDAVIVVRKDDGFGQR